jgi:hypothetical protein
MQTYSVSYSQTTVLNRITNVLMKVWSCSNFVVILGWVFVNMDLIKEERVNLYFTHYL